MDFMERTSCAITGHRPSKLPWRYDETAEGCVLLRETLAAQIATLVDSGVTSFLSGMAQGVDLQQGILFCTTAIKSRTAFEGDFAYTIP